MFQFFGSLFLTTALLAAPAAAFAQEHEHGSSEPASEAVRTNAAYFETLKTIMTGDWSGRYTNGTFGEPGEWEPVRVEYRGTSNGTALIENYLFQDDDTIGMTTVYHQDRGDLRLTHYCGAANHPSMVAARVDRENGRVGFDFTGITNLQSSTDYHSRELELEIVSNDHIRIQYHGLQNGKVYSQAYDLMRDGAPNSED